MMAATPASSNRSAISSAGTSEVSAQPSTATLPSRASRPTATRPGNAFAAGLTNSGSRTAAVPMMTRVMPLVSHASTVLRSRMPPPSCTGILTVCSIASTACAFIGLPAKAPSRSTTCRYSKPCSAKLLACAAGSRMNTAARAMSPCSRRTHWPFFRSTAGNRIIGKLSSSRSSPRRGAQYSWLPLQEIRNQRLVEALALLGMELRADRSVLGNDCGDRPAIIGPRQHVILVHRIEVIGVHEIGVAAFRSERQPLQHRMLLHQIERVPAHVRDLQALVARRDLLDIAGNPVEAVGRDVLLAAGRHQLHADTDAEEWSRLVAHRFRHGFTHAIVGVDSAPAIGEGAVPGLHDAIGAIDRIRIARHHDLLRLFHAARGAFEGLGRRMQIAGAIIDDRDSHRPPPGSGNRPMMLECGSGGGR